MKRDLQFIIVAALLPLGTLHAAGKPNVLFMKTGKEMEVAHEYVLKGR